MQYHDPGIQDSGRPSLLPGDIFIGPVPGPSSHRFRVVIWLCTLTCLPYLPSRRPSFRISRSSNVSCFAALLHTYLTSHSPHGSSSFGIHATCILFRPCFYFFFSWDPPCPQGVLFITRHPSSCFFLFASIYFDDASHVPCSTPIFDHLCSFFHIAFLRSMFKFCRLALSLFRVNVRVYQLARGQ